MKIAVIGAGYVGLSNAILLAQNNQVFLLDIVKEKVDMINSKISPIKDTEIIEYLSTYELDLTATTCSSTALSNADYVIIATPTDYEPEKNYFNTSTVETAIDNTLSFNQTATIIIKSTVPVGYTESIRKQFATDNIIFCPEFLREGKALYDNLYPSRIVIGSKLESAIKFVELVKASIKIDSVETIFTNSTEAEAIKLFANTYLAMRIAYFNELDTYAEMKGLNAQEIVRGISLDPRIGDYYNNPSFGYGGYCLPKDTKQLKSNFSDVPNSMISAVVESNRLRKDHITDMISKNNPKIVGIYKLEMKAGSDNFRNSAMHGIIRRLIEKNIDVVIYEPMYDKEHYLGAKMITDLCEFKAMSDIIVANRLCDDIVDVVDSVYTRDLFERD